MTYYVEVPVDDGAAVLVEVTNQVDGVVPAGRSQEVIARLSETFDDAFDRFSRLARGAAARARDAGGADRMTVEFGLKVAAKGGFVVAETTGEAHLKLTFEWNRRAAATPPPAPAPEADGITPDEGPEPDPETTPGSVD